MTEAESETGAAAETRVKIDRVIGCSQGVFCFFVGNLAAKGDRCLCGKRKVDVIQVKGEKVVAVVKKV